MDGLTAQAHWQRVYTEKAPTAVSWYQSRPQRSLALIERAAGLLEDNGARRAGEPLRVLDVGGGASTLVDALAARPSTETMVVDIAQGALNHAQARLGSESAARVRWVTADVTGLLADVPAGWAHIWHDRAVLHFLTTPAQQYAYARNLARVLAPGGLAIIASFAPDGPEKCSGLPVCRHDGGSIAAAVRSAGRTLTLIDEQREEHTTPWGSVQRFTYALLRS